MNTTPNSDEIDLRTLVLILRQHVKLFIIITVIVTVVGSVWTLTRPQQYQYRQTVRLMHYYVAGKWQQLQPTATLMQLVENVYLPAFEQQYNQHHPDNSILSVGKNGNYTITADDNNGILYFSTVGDNHFKVLFIAANKYFFAHILQEQQQSRTALLKHIKTQLHILNEQLPNLEKLQKIRNDYFIKVKNKKEKLSNQDIVTNILHTIYVNSLGAEQNQINVIHLQQQLGNLQQQISSFTPATLSEVIQTVKPQQLSPAMKIVLSFFVGLFLAIVVVFLKHSLRADDD